MLRADDLLHNWPLAEVKDVGWVASKPVPGPLVYRIKDAYAVLVGRAEAVKFWLPVKTPPARAHLRGEGDD